MKMQIATYFIEDLQNQASSIDVNGKYRLNVDEINPLELLEEPILTMETDQVKAEAIEETTSVLQSPDESAVEDDANKVTVKRRIIQCQTPANTQAASRGERQDFKMLRLDTEDYNISKVSTEKQKKRARDDHQNR